MIHFSKQNDHMITSIEPRGYIHFVCPEQPTMEFRSFELPKRCPICRRVNPIKMGTVEYVESENWEDETETNDDRKWVTQ
jgi:phage FluMu protein Com